MKWINHKLITFSLVFLITDNIVSSSIAALGSVFPDKLEMNPFETLNKNKDKKTIQLAKDHRKTSHWFVLYLVPALILLLYLKSYVFLSTKEFILLAKNIYQNSVLFASYVFFFFFVGCLLHIFEDALTGKVPLLNPKKKNFTLKITYTGSLSEYLLAFSIFIATLIIKFL